MTNYIDRWKSKMIVKDDCWIYTGALRSGYGWVGYKGKNMSLSRAILIELTGKHLGDKEMFSCHKCPNRACFNPDHLYWGTRKDNVSDMIKAGNHNYHKYAKRGEEHPTAKLTNSMVEALRSLNREFGLGSVKLSRMFGLNKNTVNNILYNKNRFKGVGYHNSK